MGLTLYSCEQSRDTDLLVPGTKGLLCLHAPKSCAPCDVLGLVPYITQPMQLTAILQSTHNAQALGLTVGLFHSNFLGGRWEKNMEVSVAGK